MSEGKGSQVKFWQEFYESAWAMRADYMRGFLKAGASPYQAIKELAKKERKFKTVKQENGVAWKPIDEKNEYKFTGTPGARNTSYRGKFLTVPYYAETELFNYIIDFFDQSGPFDSITELGCGYGRNLISIFYNGGPTDVPYYGGEFTDSGVKIAQELVAAEPKMKAEFFHFNHLEPKLDIDAGERALVFTCHTIEQVREIPSNWFSTVAGIAPHVTCIHFEPFGFQTKILGPASESHRDFFLKQGWNINFIPMLINAVNNKEIELIHSDLEFAFPSDASNPTSLAIWQKTNG